MRRGPLHVEQRGATRRASGRRARPARPSTRRCTRWNFDSAANSPPMRDAVEPAGEQHLAASSAATPRRCAPNPVGGARCTRRRTLRRSSRAAARVGAPAHHLLERGVDAHARTADTSAASERLTCRPSSGMTPRGSGDHHPSGRGRRSAAAGASGTDPAGRPPGACRAPDRRRPPRSRPRPPSVATAGAPSGWAAARPARRARYEPVSELGLQRAAASVGVAGVAPLA